ncbi:MAG TPA: aminotransferase class I/II-fold pyridoxal phosphate-dependent enzyme [Victivallales bacterium]|nr:aminotransferase class I/II-fold pyridoxal phosphate-dependent enzyme [Victivallales bacterium]HPO90164.1 aminotransferase class I/II-fold pyridoxal phosphate-dependent enzyme [Victivallales bacterium]HRR28818.1 aminotransferase class I/II-fold pyridoxal phosphate-dependent enzyme [Victivallales bacterium]
MKDSKSLRERGLLAKHIVSLPKSGIRDFFELVNNMDNVISLGIGEPDFVTPWTIRESAIFSIERGHTSYTSNLGLLSLRKEICRYLENNYNVEYDPYNECIITVGVSEGLDLALRAIINPGDEIIYHEPCYVSYKTEILMSHGIPVPLETDKTTDFTPDPTKLEKLITPRTKAILLNFPCNPTGAAIDRKKLEIIAKIAKKHDIFVITDEIYSELTYEGQHCSIASLPEMKERTIFLHGFSKAFAMTGFRLGYACGPFEIIDTMMKIHQYSILCAPTVAQEAALEALKNGKKEMLKMKDEYKRRRDMIVKYLNEAGLDCFMPRGAFYVFPSIRKTGLSSSDFARKFLEKHRVAVVPGNAFGSSGEGHVRCAYAASFDDILEAMRRIKIFVDEI